MTRVSVHRIAFAILLTVSFQTIVGAQETQQLFLSGHGKDDAVPWNFLCTTGAQSGVWTNIPVPSNWELHGFGTLNYKKDGTNPSPESGLYEHDFKIPKTWMNKKIFLVFDGAMTDTSAKLNGASVGAIHQGGFYRFKYDVTALVKTGVTNKLEVTVAKHSTNNSVNRAERLADFWVFGGIYRPVYLEAMPTQYIERVAIDAKADGAFAMNVVLGDVTDADRVEVQITTRDGKKVGRAFSAKISGDSVMLKGKTKSPLKWTAETPNLYVAKVRLKRGRKVVHEIQQRFGFRTFEVRDGDGLYLNGQKIILKGVNRHSFWPDSGRCLSEAVQRLDIESIKDMNGNAVRMSHYPPDAQFLDLCDELGLYVLDELTGWHNYYDNNVGPKLVKEMVTRDANHPSILFWDNGNEGGFNTNLDKLFGQYDLQDRRVLHPWAGFNGLCTMHYLAYDKAEIAASGQRVYFQAPDKELVATNDLTKYIYMPTEFSHGLFDGGAAASLADYWSMMMRHTNCAGGFIWTWVDEGLKRPDTGQIDTAGNQAPDGIVGPYREREGSFNAIKEIWSPVFLNLDRVAIEPNRIFAIMTVSNRFDFNCLSNCHFVASLVKFHRPRDRKSGADVIEQWTKKGPPVMPGNSAAFVWDFRGVISDEVDAIDVVAEDPNGRFIWEWCWPLSKLNDLGQNIPLPDGGVSVSESTDRITVATGNQTVEFNKLTGLLEGVKIGGQFVSLTNGPRAVVGGQTLENIAVSNTPTEAIVTASYTGGLKNVTWHVQNNGWLRCDFTYTATGQQSALGVVFDYPENLVQGKAWLGNGPFRVWKNRLEGELFGVCANAYNNTITGYKDWIYPEFKGCFADVRWLRLGTSEGTITVVPENIPFVQVLTPELPPTNLVGQAFAKLPQCGLGFLHAIPPIGSKFKRADQCGPQSQLTVAQGEYSGSVSFFFGELPEVTPKKRKSN